MAICSPYTIAGSDGFLWLLVKKDHKLGGLKQQSFSLSQIWRLKPIKALAGLCSLYGSRGES